MEKTIDIIMQIALVIVLSWTVYMFNKAMKEASYHPYDETIYPKGESKNS